MPKNISENNTGTIAIGYPNDIIIAKGGNTLAKTGLLTEDYNRYLLSRDLILIRTDKIKKSNKYYLWVFLHCKFGQSMLWRTASQTGQPHLTLPAIKDLLIPRFSLHFENRFEKLYRDSVINKINSKSTYAQAESLLLESLGMAGFVGSSDGVNVKSFQASFATTGRLDAEYYQKKYENYRAHIANYPEGFAPLQEVCTLKDQNFTPKDEMEYRYIELSDIDKSGSVTGCTTDLGKELPSRARRTVSAGDVLISSIEGSLSSCALVAENFDGALCSTGFYVISSQNINSESLLVLFKSELMQQIMKQNCSGTILTAMNKNEFEQLPIPLINQSTQTKIVNLVRESFALKQKSEQLLEAAKRAVEIAIEQDEAVALAFLETEISQ